jgi:deoxyribodipyrimidine photo-lyase
MTMHKERIHRLNKTKEIDGPVLYWMSRDQRLYDNWSFVFAADYARKRNQPLVIVFVLAKKFLGATVRQYDFMLAGLREVQKQCARKNIPFYMILGDPTFEIPTFVKKYKVATVVTDFDPLRLKQRWQAQLAKKLAVPFYEVDAHNIVPCRFVSSKCEYGAYTLRPKIHRVLAEFLDEFPKVRTQPIAWEHTVPAINWERLLTSLVIDRAVKPLVEWKPGFRAAQKRLDFFCDEKLAAYDDLRNDPAWDGQSGLSPYLHFGQISAQRVAIQVARARVSSNKKDPFLEELIVRRELADNFCLYKTDYDSFTAFPVWAQNTLERHWQDTRQSIYSRADFEHARTHDMLWNAAQSEMVTSGKMHGYMRMYWAKKILEWSRDPEEAQKIAIYLNDKYELDGRDPNGYAGIAWSIGGVHDRAWGERPVFGKVRFMSFNGCKSKFDISAYVEKVERLV